MESTGIGLENIRSRYNYLLKEDIQIAETEKYFEVRVPIIEMS